ncbi:MAG: hypothetical protein E6H01_06480 [Bacillati bacterium ANGP1]|uniref:Mannose-6-phosphate isomerase n=1 Tax=Candidatus Segetimicrobium genomatis TaxID=2569760 RepID=A0A537L3P7_9BACT|nr:MAG: hypothetical protein E6H01_06480 [Terrabacteria group bacterium ANGP1]
MRRVEQALDRLLDRGVLPLLPNYVRRLYMDGGRLPISRRPGDTYVPRARMWRPERWIGSTVPAMNPHPISDEGIGRIDAPGGPIKLTAALRMRGRDILGSHAFAAYGPDFPILIKILDPAQTIGFHFHARDEDVWAHPARFGGQRFGKDEAYYFLDAPKGPIPYTHVGLFPGTTRRVLAEAIAAGGGRVLELSPVIHQRIGEGFFVPAGIPHRPGTALTLEVQEPSDVYTMLERESGGRKLTPAEMHPGFASIDQALAFVDFKTACDPGLGPRGYLRPEPVRGERARGGRAEWIFPPRLRKFSGKRLVVRTRFQSVEGSAYVALVWRGRGRVNGMRIHAGSEFLVTARVATHPHLYEAEGGQLEVFMLFPPDPEHFRRVPR